jgi:hypothetical protein
MRKRASVDNRCPEVQAQLAQRGYLTLVTEQDHIGRPAPHQARGIAELAWRWARQCRCGWVGTTTSGSPATTAR